MLASGKLVALTDRGVSEVVNPGRGIKVAVANMAGEAGKAAAEAIRARTIAANEAVAGGPTRVVLTPPPACHLRFNITSLVADVVTFSFGLYIYLGVFHGS